jgi:XTP/dITP diphosphohydrolase
MSGNAHKVQELSASFPWLDLLTLRDYPIAAEPVEDSDTFEGNALIKASAGLAHLRALSDSKARLIEDTPSLIEVMTLSSSLSLADDSGVCVDALDGAPGVLSARYAPGSDAHRTRALLDALTAAGAHEPSARRARFICVLALCGLTEGDAERLGDLSAFPGLTWGWSAAGERALIAEGCCEGSIALTPRGAGGFGYDPVFLLPDGRCVAELSEREKAAISHRGAAVRALAPALRALFSKNKNTENI